MRSVETGTDRLLIDISDRVATLTFNNPAKRNALSLDMRRALPQVLHALQDDGDEVQAAMRERLMGGSCSFMTSFHWTIV